MSEKPDFRKKENLSAAEKAIADHAERHGITKAAAAQQIRDAQSRVENKEQL